MAWLRALTLLVGENVSHQVGRSQLTHWELLGAFLSRYLGQWLSAGFNPTDIVSICSYCSLS